MVKHVSRAFLALAVLSSRLPASSLAPTQLEGVKGAMVLSFVSQYLPSDIKALEPDLKAMATRMLKDAALKTSSPDQQYLTIDVSGEPVKACPGRYLLRIAVEFKEPVVLKRAPSLPIPNQVVVMWHRSPSFVASESSLASEVTDTVQAAVAAFIEEVQMMNSRPPAKVKP